MNAGPAGGLHIPITRHSPQSPLEGEDSGQGKVKRIQKKTLNALAQRLSVEPEEIQTF